MSRFMNRLHILMLSLASCFAASSLVPDCAEANENHSPWALCVDSDSTEVASLQAFVRHRELQLERSEQVLTYAGSALWSVAYSIEVLDTVAYVLNINGIQIFNIADLSNPYLVKQISLSNSSSFNRTWLDGNYLYLGRYDRFHVFDVSNPYDPQEVHETVLSGLIREIQILGDRAYVGIARYNSETTEQPALYIMDVSDPSTPIVIGKYESPWDHKDAREFAVVDDYVFAVNQWDHLVDVIFIGDETRPEHVGSFDITFPFDLIYRDGYLYVEEYYQQIKIYDVSTPETPVLHDSIIIDSRTLRIHDDRLYSENSGYITVFDFPAPGSINLLGEYDCGNSYPLTLVDTLMFVPKGTFGFEIDNVASPWDIATVTDHVYQTHITRGLDVSGDYAYVVNHMSVYGGTNRNGVHIVDISDKNDPTFVGWEQPAMGNPREAYVHEDLLFMSECHPTNIYSLADPTDPVLLSQIGNFTWSNAARGDLMYVCSGAYGLIAADISDPSNPDSLSAIDIADHSTNEAILVGNLAYVSVYYGSVFPHEAHLWTVDISDPSNIVLIDSMRIGGSLRNSYQMVSRGNYVYFAGGEIGLSALDISNPTQPDIAYCHQPGGEVYTDVVLKRNYLFVSTYGSIQVFDLLDLIYPELIQYVPMPSIVWRLDVQGDCLFAVSEFGFYIFEMDLPPVACGDVNGSENVDIDDVVFLIAYIFSGGPEPLPYEAGDPDCSGAVDIDDVVYLIAYIFSGGNEPYDTDGDGDEEC